MNTSWVEDRRIAYSQIAGCFDAKGLNAFNVEASSILDEGTAPVHFVLDVSAMNLSVFDLDEIAREMPFIEHPSLGCLVFTGSTPMLSYMGHMLARRARTRFQSVRSLEDAIYYLCMQDGTL